MHAEKAFLQATPCARLPARDREVRKTPFFGTFPPKTVRGTGDFH